MLKNKKSLILYLIAIGVICFFFVFLISVSFMGFSIKNHCEIAQDKYDGDCVEALISYLQDEQNGFYMRNRTIWALGQLGDERALPVLQSFYTGYNGERIDRSQELSQYELQRAIGYFNGNWNITTFFWRFGENL